MSARTATPAATKNKTGGLLATIANNARQYGIVGALLVIVIVFQILTGGVLLKPNSFVSLIQQNAYVIILAIGMVMVIIATHIDLSVGSLVAFIGGVCALLMERQGVWPSSSPLPWASSSASGRVSGSPMSVFRASSPHWPAC